MSGVIKKLGKALKRVVKSKVFKIIVIAAAVYFTAGIAAGAMGSQFAASLPGITTAAEALGINAGAFAPSAVATLETAASGLSSTVGGMGLEAGAGSAAAATGDAMAVSGGWVSAEGGAGYAGGMAAEAAGATESALAASSQAGAEGIVNPMAEYGGSPLGTETPQTLTAGQEKMLANSSAMEGGGTVQSSGYDLAPQVEHQVAESTAGQTAAPSSPTPGAPDYADFNYNYPGETRWGTPVADSTPAGESVWTKFSNWWGERSPTTQTILAQAGFGVAKGLYEGIAGSRAADAAAEQRKDLHRVNYVDNSGIVNRFFQSEFSPKRG